jgi:hypothetical protein
MPTGWTQVWHRIGRRRATEPTESESGAWLEREGEGRKTRHELEEETPIGSKLGAKEEKGGEESETV